MILVACSSQDIASANAAKALIRIASMQSREGKLYSGDGISLQIVDMPLPMAQGLHLDGIELVIFMSRHSSASKIPAMTVHPMGNWGAQAQLGGLPRTLSMSAPSPMLGILGLLVQNAQGIAVTYEATHHGPVLQVPSLFAEFGGTQEAISSEKYATLLAQAVHSFCNSFIDRDKRGAASEVVIGIGGTHYPGRFTSLALKKGYAFSHIMPKHAILNPDGTDNIGMLEQAIIKSSEPVGRAVIDWKSINSGPRSSIIKKLDELGVGYERI